LQLPTDPRIHALITKGMNREPPLAQLTDKMPARIGVMAGIITDTRVDVANPSHLLSSVFYL
jgi:hypothetical protein